MYILCIKCDGQGGGLEWASTPTTVAVALERPVAPPIWFCSPFLRCSRGCCVNPLAVERLFLGSVPAVDSLKLSCSQCSGTLSGGVAPLFWVAVRALLL
jgi:hypothetical protein